MIIEDDRKKERTMRRSKTDYVAAKNRANLSVGDVIKMTCELGEMSQAELSRRSGVSPSNLSDIIHGRRPVGKAVAERLAQALNVSPAFILFAGEAPRKGSEMAISPLSPAKQGLLLRALRTLRANENERAEKRRHAMREAIGFISQALKAAPQKDLAPLKVITHAPKDARPRSRMRHRS